MAFARVACRAQLGLSAPLVHVEVSLAAGLPAFCIVGLPAMVVREAKERVRAALLNSRFEFPAGRITVNLAPADLPKEGGRFDLPIALGILLASRQIAPATRGTPREISEAREFYGELGLTGELKPVPGLLPAAAQAQRCGHELIVPRGNACEARIVAPQLVRAADTLLEVCAHIAGTAPLPADRASGRPVSGVVPPPVSPDLAEVRGQLHAKRALVVAAAGAHSLLMIGPPGTGKSMLARRLPGLLPPLTGAEALEVAAINSVSAGGFRGESFGERPFRAPHHSASWAALVGGGARARPGEVSLAHHGVLFLDELPEFGRAVLETLREPLETGLVAVARAERRTEYPAAFQLVAAMNPCPCGFLGEPSGKCRCTPTEVLRYRGRVSGPLLDRLDLQVEVPRVPVSEFAGAATQGAGSCEAALIVARAREVQLARQGVCNARLTDAGVQRWCVPDERGRRLLDTAMQRLGLSGRGRQRVLKVARTIADIEGRPTIAAAQVTEALALRTTAPETPCNRRPA
ncbi:MAG: YifB family Mg chelatase-like AAA ATPase [Steroidobacteraceae bacterium]